MLSLWIVNTVLSVAVTERRDTSVCKYRSYYGDVTFVQTVALICFVLGINTVYVSRIEHPMWK